MATNFEVRTALDTKTCAQCLAEEEDEDDGGDDVPRAWATWLLFSFFFSWRGNAAFPSPPWKTNSLAVHRLEFALAKSSS